jgi:hypothetical protein
VGRLKRIPSVPGIAAIVYGNDKYKDRLSVVVSSVVCHFPNLGSGILTSDIAERRVSTFWSGGDERGRSTLLLCWYTDHEVQHLRNRQCRSRSIEFERGQRGFSARSTSGEPIRGDVEG